MANKEIADLTAAAAITGAETLHLVQSGNSRKATADEIARRTAATGALEMPSGTTAQRPTATAGRIRWNSTTGKSEVANGTAFIPFGRVLGFQRATSAAYTSTTAAIPVDDTIPQSTEGLELLTLSYTPQSSASTLLIFVNIPVATLNSLGSFVTAIFNGASSAIQTSEIIIGASNYRFGVATHAAYAPGSTSAQTISVRVGPATASTAYIGGLSSGSLFSTSTVSSLLVIEVE